MNQQESEQYLLDHLEQDHPGLLNWQAMTHRVRALLHHADPHYGTNHTHYPVVYVP